MVDIVFIIPEKQAIFPIRKKYFKDNQSYLNIGVGVLAEHIREQGFRPFVIDLNHVDLFDGLRMIEEINPRFVGIQFFSTFHDESVAHINSLLKQHLGIPTIIGGAAASLMAEEVHSFCQPDLLVIGEGEETIIDVLRGASLDGVPGLIQKRLDGPVQWQPRHYLEELDALPFPRYLDFDLSLYHKVIPLLVSRGCPYQCIFCDSQIALGKVYRHRSIQHVRDELSYWYAQGRRLFSLVDDTIHFIDGFGRELIDLLGEYAGIEVYFNNIRADSIDRQALAAMKRVGVTKIGFSPESGSNKVLERIRKRFTVEQVEEAVEASLELGFEISLNFIVGAPGETWEDFLLTYEMATRYPVKTVKLHNLAPIFSTPLYNEVEANKWWSIDDPKRRFGYRKEPERAIWEPYFETPEFTKAERMRALKMSYELMIEKGELV